MGCHDIWDEEDAKHEKELKRLAQKMKDDAITAFVEWVNRAGEGAEFNCVRGYDYQKYGTGKDFFEIRTSIPKKFTSPRT